jgi:uncharacterized protein YqhQ
MPHFTYGGQALVEGVLMRGRNAIAVAFRHPDGRIVWATERLDSGFHGSRIAKLPFVRGLVVLYETLIVGSRWLVRSAAIQASEAGAEIGRGLIATMLIVTLVVVVGIFFLLPLVLASATAGNQSSIVQHLVEGGIRVALFIGYLLLISRAGDVKRVFQYHGAEHMTIHALEHDEPLTTEAVRRYPTAHPRCGTEFLVIVIILSILAFSLIGRQEPVLMVGSRIVLIPVIASIGYELLRFGAKHRDKPLIRWFYLPGMWVQMITTKQPTDDLIVVAIVSMEQALVADGERWPEGSADIERQPLDTVAKPSGARVPPPAQGQPPAPIQPPAAES